ncbi:MAG: hypothetical protein WCR55_04160 [Lentisphaerota bacterium]
MKIRNKLLSLTLIALNLLLFQVFADEETATEEKQVESSQITAPESKSEKQEVEQVKSIDVRYSAYDRDNTDVNGVRFGLPMSSGLGTVDGAEISLVCSDTANIIGFQGALLVNMTNNLNGFQMGMANMIREHGKWGQLGVICFAAKRVEGFQMSLFNYSRGTDGVQIGIISYAEDLSYLQFGILCYNKEAWVPMLIGINFDPAIFESSYDDEDLTVEDPEGQTVAEDESEITPDTTSDTAKAKEKEVSWFSFLE